MLFRLVLLISVAHAKETGNDFRAWRNEACRELRYALNISGEGNVVAGISDSSSQCTSLEVPHSNSVSGGYCLASLTGAGWYRATAFNPLVELVVGVSGEYGSPPILSASNSGGSMFITRYFALRDATAEAVGYGKWTYPCTLLQEPFKTVCFFHGNYGAISSECDSDTLNLIYTATLTVYGPLIMAYGGPFGVLAAYLTVYFPFLHDLPIPSSDAGFWVFWQKRAHWNAFHDVSSDWVVAHTEDNPNEAEDGIGGQYNYGFDSYYSRGFRAKTGTGWYSNMTVYQVCSISANTPSGMVIFPFSFAGKQWELPEAQTAAGFQAVGKLAGMLISLTMVKSTMVRKQLTVTTKAPQCEEGCPLMDGGFTDNAPLTPILAAASDLPLSIHPRQVALLGPANNMANILYLMGQGPLDIWTFAGLNMCPFTQTSICRMITQTRKLLLTVVDTDTQLQYRTLAGVYSVWRPSQQVITPFCADPLVFDHFNGECYSDSYCHMWTITIPAMSTRIKFTVDVHLFALTMLWLAPSPIAARFVEEFIPSAMLKIDYYSNLKDWFPDFVAVAPQKGGLGFTKPAGHSLLDFMTYLSIRLIFQSVRNREVAHQMYLGQHPHCGWEVYLAVAGYNDNQKYQTR